MAPSTRYVYSIATCHHYSLSTPSLKPHQFIDLAKICADRGKAPLRFGEYMILLCLFVCLFVVVLLGFCEYIMFLLVLFMCIVTVRSCSCYCLLFMLLLLLC